MLRKKYDRAAILTVATAIVAVGFASGVKGSVITGWTFENDAVAVNNSPSPSTGAGTASSIGMDAYPTPNVGVTTDDVLIGKSTDTGANTMADTTNTWRVRAQAGANGAANGWSSAAPIGAQGAVFAGSTAGYSNVTVGFDWYTTTQGEANLMLRYTNNISAATTVWTDAAITVPAADTGLVAMTNTTDPNTVAGPYVSDNLLSNGAPSGQNWFTGLTATINDPLAANNANFAFELVDASTGASDVSTQGTALNNTSGNWRFDNISIDGTSVPEPTSIAALTLAAAAMLGRRRKNG